MPPGGVYRRVWLPHLHRLGVAERVPYLPGSRVEVPALAFGTTDLGAAGIVEEPPQGAGAVPLAHPPIDAYVLHDVVVHGRFGLVTSGEMVLGETTSHLPIHLIPGAEWLDEARLRLPEQPTDARLPAAYHLLAGNQENYFHWLLEGVSRFDAAEFRGYGVLGLVGDDLCLLTPPLDTPWKRQSFDLLVPTGLRQGVLAGSATVQAERLIYIPQLAGGGVLPHRGLLAVFDRMRAAAYAALRAEPAVPWRKLFISRADSGNRALVNEAEVAALAAAAGFTRVVLGGMPVAEQVRLFAEATHIVAPHGAGLANLVFCRPGTAVCELHMDCYVQWAFRRLAALRGLRYGCVIGPHLPPRHPWPHRNTWRIDPAAVAAALADPRFAA